MVMGPVTTVVIDAVDVEAVAAFWSRLLDSPESARDDGTWVELGPLGDGGPVLAFQKVPDHRTAPNRVHLDVAADDLATATVRATALGASAVGGVRGDRSPWQIMRDPEGNTFCLVTSG